MFDLILSINISDAETFVIQETMLITNPVIIDTVVSFYTQSKTAINRECVRQIIFSHNKQPNCSRSGFCFGSFLKYNLNPFSDLVVTELTSASTDELCLNHGFWGNVAPTFICCDCGRVLERGQIILCAE